MLLLTGGVELRDSGAAAACSRYHSSRARWLKKNGALTGLSDRSGRAPSLRERLCFRLDSFPLSSCFDSVLGLLVDDMIFDEMWRRRKRVEFLGCALSKGSEFKKDAVVECMLCALVDGVHDAAEAVEETVRCDERGTCVFE